MTTVLFYLLALAALAGAAGMVTVRQPISAALSFIVVLVSLAGLYALLSNSFLFAVQIILYAGAIITLMLFIIMFLNVKEQNLPDEPGMGRQMFLGLAGVLPIAGTAAYAVSGIPGTDLSVIISGFGEVKALGQALFTDWIFPFELISILLLAALVGAVTLGKGARTHG